MGLDEVSLQKVGGVGTGLIGNGSFYGGHLQVSSGDYAANYLSRLGGTDFCQGGLYFQASEYLLDHYRAFECELYVTVQT